MRRGCFQNSRIAGRGDTSYFATFLLLTCFLSIAGCAQSSYMGVPLNGQSLSQNPFGHSFEKAQYRALPLPEVAVRASQGEKSAQLELGKRFEEGRGVEVDLSKARRLYQKASADSGGEILMHVPGSNGGVSGRIERFGRGAKRKGLAEAASRLRALEDRIADMARKDEE